MAPRLASLFLQEMPASAIDDALTPLQQTFFSLRFRIFLEQLKKLYIAMSLIIFFDLSLIGL